MEKHIPLKWPHYLLVACAMIACVLLFWNPRSQSPSWIFPYFSGAANLGLDLAWRVDLAAFADFAGMSYGQQMEYRFLQTEASNLATYSVLDKGYVFVIWIAQNLLFWLPQIKAVIWFQILFHVLSSLWVLGQLGSRRQQVIFVLAYAINPIVLHFVTFAYHYYWQVIPSLAWFYYEARSEARTDRRLYMLVLVLAAAFLIRQSTIIVSIFILGYAAWKRRTVAAWVAVACFLFFAVIAKNPSQPWHTAYVGIGAYPNDAGIELSDEAGYRMFKDRTGIQIDTTPPNGNYYDEKARGQYYEVLKERLKGYAKDHPLQLVRNALLNVAQSFSVGYPVGHLALAYASAIAGLIALVVLAIRRMYVTIALIFTGVAGFVAYYPPIPAYMFGNYLLLALALASIVDQIGNSGEHVAFGRYLKERLFRLP
jgi:hypothetical protein